MQQACSHRLMLNAHRHHDAGAAVGVHGAPWPEGDACGLHVSLLRPQPEAQDSMFAHAIQYARRTARGILPDRLDTRDSLLQTLLHL